MVQQQRAGPQKPIELCLRCKKRARAVQVTGDFGNHDAVRICDGAGQEVGRGLSNYAREEVAKIMVRSPCSGPDPVTAKPLRLVPIRRNLRRLPSIEFPTVTNLVGTVASREGQL